MSGKVAERIRVETASSTPTAEVGAGGALEADDAHPSLLHWRRNVGDAVVLDLAPPLPARPAGVDLLCWNLAIGAARLDDLLARLRAEHPGGMGAQPERPLVILAQEAYRADASVPALHFGPFHGGRVRVDGHTDVVAFARRHGMSLRYAPSMRNGAARSDRGNAILATCAIGSTYAFSLPLLRQRRVAVAADLVGLPKLTFVSTHLENRTGLAHGLRSAVGFGSRRAEQAEALWRRIIAAEAGDVVLGADLNTARGSRDPAYQSLLRAGFQPAPRVGRWTHTYHGLMRLPLDHVLVHTGGGPVRSTTVRRIDEHPQDRSWRIFGSDHHPLLARIELSGPVAPSPATDHDPR
jgi:endonuclease/exonuclease/phosphatase family metal-dependent hydrolase